MKKSVSHARQIMQPILQFRISILLYIAFVGDSTFAQSNFCTYQEDYFEYVAKTTSELQPVINNSKSFWTYLNPKNLLPSKKKYETVNKTEMILEKRRRSVTTCCRGFIKVGTECLSSSSSTMKSSSRTPDSTSPLTVSTVMPTVEVATVGTMSTARVIDSTESNTKSVPTVSYTTNSPTVFLENDENDAVATDSMATQPTETTTATALPTTTVATPTQLSHETDPSEPMLTTNMDANSGTEHPSEPTITRTFSIAAEEYTTTINARNENDAERTVGTDPAASDVSPISALGDVPKSITEASSVSTAVVSAAMADSTTSTSATPTDTRNSSSSPTAEDYSPTEVTDTTPNHEALSHSAVVSEALDATVSMAYALDAPIYSAAAAKNETFGSSSFVQDDTTGAEDTRTQIPVAKYVSATPNTTGELQVLLNQVPSEKSMSAENIELESSYLPDVVASFKLVESSAAAQVSGNPAISQTIDMYDNNDVLTDAPPNTPSRGKKNNFIRQFLRALQQFFRSAFASSPKTNALSDK